MSGGEHAKELGLRSYGGDSRSVYAYLGMAVALTAISRKSVDAVFSDELHEGHFRALWR